MMKMYTCVLFVAVFVATIQAKLGNRLRSNEPCDEEGFYGDHLDCRKFYRCASHSNPDGTKVLSKYEFMCPSGTIYDDSISTCNHPSSVENPPKDCPAEEPNTSTNESGQGDSKSLTPILLSYTPGWISHFPISNYLFPVSIQK